MRVSVVIAAYNATWCIGRALDSLLAQTRVPDEVLICDDGSTDGLPEWVEARYGAPIRVLHLAHRNSPAARRVGLDQAEGDWLAFMDADDMWEANKLERQLEVLQRRPEVRWIGSDGLLFSDDGVVRESWLSDYFEPVRDMGGDLMAPLVERCFPLVSSMMVERNAYHEVGGIDPNYTYSHDYDLWLRLAARYPGIILADKLIRYYTGPNTLSRRFEARHRDDLRIMEKIAKGGLTQDPAVRRRAAERAAAFDFDLAILCVRSGRMREARLRLWRSARHGPLRRRLLALGGALAPRWSMRRLMRSNWLKTRVAGARRAAPRFSAGSGGTA